MTGLTRTPDDFDAWWCAVCTGNGFVLHPNLQHRDQCPTCNGTGSDPIPRDERISTALRPNTRTTTGRQP